MSKKVRVFSPLQYEPRSKIPVIVRHLEWFRYLGSNPLMLKIGEFSLISKPFFIYITLFLIFHTTFFIYHLTELENRAPFSTALAVFRRSVFALGPIVSFYKFVKNRIRMGKALDELVAIQQVFGIANYKMFLSMKIYFVMALIASVYRTWMGVAALYGHRSVNDAVKYLESAALTMYFFGCMGNFVYLVKSISACVRHLSDFGLKDKIDDPSIRRYVKVYNHLVTISEEINDHFDACVSFCFLACFLNLMDSTSDLLTEEEDDDVQRIWKLMKFGLGLTGILFVVTTGQSAIDQAENCNEVLYASLIHLKSLPVENNILTFVVMHLGAEKMIRYRMCESFAINYNLAISMAAAYVTYITVMFQLDHSSSLNGTKSNNSIVG